MRTYPPPRTGQENPSVNKTASAIPEAAGILHSVFIFVFLPLLLDNLYVSPLSAHSGPHLSFLYMIFYLIVKSFLYAGLYGSLAELATGEEIVLSFNRFKQNARRFWKIYFILAILSFIVHIGILFIFSSQQTSFLPLFSSGMNILLDIIFLVLIVDKKYFKPAGQSWRNMNMPPAQGGLVSAFYLFELMLRLLLNIFPPKSLYFSPLILLGAHYTHLLAGLILLTSIKNHAPLIRNRFEQGKEIYLISPIQSGMLFGIASLFQRDTYPPLFIILKALSPAGYKFREFTRLLWHKRYCRKGKLAAITCLTSNSYEAYKIAKEFKRQGSKVVMGGPHVSYFPDEALEYCDSVVIGEAEGVWEEIVKDYESGRLKRVYCRRSSQENYRRVYRGLLSSPPAVMKYYLETTSGCKFKCDFCAIPGLFNGRTRKTPVENITALVGKVSRRYKRFTFIDNNIYSHPGHARELFKALKPLKVRWSSQCTIDIAKNERTLQLAKESGCQFLLCGYEIAGRSLENKRKGKFSMARHYEALTRRIKRKGIKIKGNFIFGFESDTLRSLFRLWAFCLKIRPSLTILYFLTPLPGSKTFFDMLKENRLTNLNWRRYTCCEFVFRHKHLNTRLLNVLFPLLYPFFLITTSTLGRLLGLILVITLLDMFIVVAA